VCHRAGTQSGSARPGTQCDRSPAAAVPPAGDIGSEFELLQKPDIEQYVSASVRAILVSIGEPTTPPEVAPARGPPAGDEAFERVRGWNETPVPVPAFVFDQRLGW